MKSSCDSEFLDSSDITPATSGGSLKTGIGDCRLADLFRVRDSSDHLQLPAPSGARDHAWMQRRRGSCGVGWLGHPEPDGVDGMAGP